MHNLNFGLSPSASIVSHPQPLVTSPVSSTHLHTFTFTLYNISVNLCHVQTTYQGYLCNAAPRKYGNPRRIVFSQKTQGDIGSGVGCYACVSVFMHACRREVVVAGMVDRHALMTNMRPVNL